MTISGNQAAIVADLITTQRVDTEQSSVWSRLVAMVSTWRAGGLEARAEAREQHRQHVETHWQKLHADHDDSWRWRANGF